MKFRHLQIVFLTQALLLVPLSACADAAPPSSEAVANFTQTATLTRSSELDVSQQIDYDYGSVKPHDIIYSIPTSYHDDQGLEYRVAFKLQNATVQGVPVDLRPEINAAVVTLTLPPDGHADELEHFLINYSLRPTAIVADQGDVFRIAVTGLSWPVPLNHVTLMLQTPAPVDNVVCSTGAQTTDSNDCDTTQQTTSVMLTSESPILPGGAMSVTASFPHHSFTSYMQAYTAPGGWMWLIAPTVIAALILLVVPIIIIRRQRRRKIVAPRVQEYTKDNDVT
jgi:Predicted membrane protein (DUF2207)